MELYRNLTGNFFNKYQLATAEVKAMEAELRYAEWEARRAKERRDEAEKATANLKGQVEELTAEKSCEVALARAQSAIHQQKVLSMEQWLLDYVQNKEIQCMQLQAEMLVRSMESGQTWTAGVPYEEMSLDADSEVRENAGQPPKSSAAEASYVETSLEADREVRENAGQPPKLGDGTVEDDDDKRKLELIGQVLNATSRKMQKITRSKMASLKGYSLQRVVDVRCMKPVGRVEQ